MSFTDDPPDRFSQFFLFWFYKQDNKMLNYFPLIYFKQI